MESPDLPDSLYTPLDESVEEIRLLEILPESSEFGDIECRLTTFPLASAPFYTAISYTWGDPNKTVSITVDGRDIMVTESLWQVLALKREIKSYLSRKLERKDGEELPDDNYKYFWIDALCINQEDHKEKEDQIGRMRDIYQRGSVDTHLGLNFEFEIYSETGMLDDDSEALECLRRLAKCQLDDHGDPTGTLEQIPWRQIIRFCQRPWFSRMWIIQEFLSAGQGSLMYSGSLPIANDELFYAFLQLSKRSASLQFDERYALLSSIRYYIVLFMSGAYLGKEQHEAGALVSYLWRFRDHIATDARDKVYGLLSLFQWKDLEGPMLAETPGHQAENEGAIKPQYYDEDHLIVDYSGNTSVEKIYSSVVKSIVVATHRLEIICACQGDNPEFKKSWTPDWRQPWSRISLLEWNMSIESFWHTENCNASGSREASAAFNDALDILSADGIFYSTVTTIAPETSDDLILKIIAKKSQTTEISNELGDQDNGTGAEGQEKDREDCNNKLRGMTSAKDNFGRVVDDVDPHMRQWFHTCDTVLESFLLYANRPELYNKKSVSKSLFEAMGAGGFNYRSMRDFEGLGTALGQLSRTRNMCRGISKATYKQIWEADRFLGRFIEVSQGRRLFLTGAGEFGLGPDHLREGDLVCVLLGCHVPVIIRKIASTLPKGNTEAYYLFIGECYIHSIMKGELVEALDRGELAVQTFELH